MNTLIKPTTSWIFCHHETFSTTILRSFSCNEQLHFIYIFQHHCQKAQINGRDGVIVAGGSSDVHPALSSVEFFDLDLGRWLNLGKLREPRRFPSILVMSNHLLVAGNNCCGWGACLINLHPTCISSTAGIPLYNGCYSTIPNDYVTW